MAAASSASVNRRPVPGHALALCDSSAADEYEYRIAIEHGGIIQR
jgi:hypothetical protein